MQRILKFAYNHVHWFVLLGIIFVAIWLRLQTAGFDVLLDYDPWWFFRHAQTLVNNGLLPPKWDLQSFYPPGRPVDFYLGWSYTIAVFYLITKTFISNLSLAQFAGYFVAVFAASSAIPAYFVGRFVTNRWGGLATAFFATVTPAFLSVSMAGYSDSDAVDVFYSFLAVLTTIYALKKSPVISTTNFQTFYKSLIKYLPHLIPALVAYWLFAFNWNSSWYIYYMFVGFLPLLVVFRVIESVFKREGNLMVSVVNKIKETKNLAIALLLLGLIGELITLPTSGWPFNTAPPHQQLIEGANLVRGQSMIVFVSVAELQTVNVFTREGFNSVVNREGGMPMFFALLAVFLIIPLKLIFKKEIHLVEYFALIWLLISFWLITRGIRFSLLFSIAVATAAGFTVGNIIEFFREYGSRRGENLKLFFGATVFALIIFGSFWHLSDNITFSKSTQGLEVNDNWKQALTWLKNNADEDSLITTWWDPGHIITGFTGLKAMADGAHCGALSCKPYDHNIRIQDMGRVFSTDSEPEAVTILSKYMNLTESQCNEVKRTFGDRVPPEACKPVSNMYVIASSDLIGKYYWLSFFGKQDGRNFAQLPLSGQDEQGNLNYGGVITLSALQDGGVVAIINVPQQGIRNAIVKDIVYFQQDGEKSHRYSNMTNVVDGMVWVSPGFGSVMFMPPDIRDSIFTRMFFFDGRDLQHFKQVFANSEVKIYKVSF